MAANCDDLVSSWAQTRSAFEPLGRDNSQPQRCRGGAEDYAHLGPKLAVPGAERLEPMGSESG